MVATGALGTGLDLNGIMHVIHVGLPRSLIEYGQESGRAGWGGEKVKAVILATSWEVQKLEQNGMEPMTEDEIWLIKYVRELECCQAVLREYFDGADKTENYKILDREERCENLRSRFNPQSHYKERVRQVQSVVRTESRQVQRMREILHQLVDHCGPCWVRYGWEKSDHKARDCGELERILGTSYMETRKRRRYDKDACCYICSVPADQRKPYRTGVVCEEVDVVLPLCLAG